MSNSRSNLSIRSTFKESWKGTSKGYIALDQLKSKEYIITGNGRAAICFIKGNAFEGKVEVHTLSSHRVPELSSTSPFPIMSYSHLFQYLGEKLIDFVSIGDLYL